MPPISRLAAALSLIAAMTLTGANVAFARAIVAEFPVYVFVLFRFVVASLALALLVRGEPGPKLSAMSRAQWRDLTLMALLGMVGFTVLMFEGLKRTAAADAGIITATLPAVAAVLGVAFAGDRLSRLQQLAIVLAVAGLVLVQAIGDGAWCLDALGNLLIGGAVLCEASFVLLGKRLAPPYRPLRLALGANLVGLVLSVPLALPQLPAFDPASVRRRDLGARHLVCARRQRRVPVAVVPRPALCRDLARGARHRRRSAGRARHVGVVPRRGDRAAQARRRRAGDRRHRAGGTGAVDTAQQRQQGWFAMMPARNSRRGSKRCHGLNPSHCAARASRWSRWPSAITTTSSRR